MKAIVTKDGVLIPKRLLKKGVKQVDIRQEGGRIVVFAAPSAKDPIFGLGRRPVCSGVTDASVDHDKYLYGNE